MKSEITDTDWEWIKDLSIHGLTSVVIQDCRNLSFKELMQGIDEGLFVERMGERLKEQSLGEWASMERSGAGAYVFYNVPTGDLPKALALIKSEMERAAVLPNVKIGYADAQDQVWRTFHPRGPMREESKGAKPS